MSGLECSEVSMKNIDLGDRIDAEYFTHTYLHIESLLSQKETVPLKKLGSLVASAFYPAATQLYDSGEVPFVRCVDSISFPAITHVQENSFERIPESFISENKGINKIKQNDIVITKVGTPCFSSIVKDYDEVALSRTVLGLTDIQKVIPEYLLVFLRSQYGFLQLFRMRELTIQYQLTLDRVGKINVLLPSSEFQSNIKSVFEEYLFLMKQSVKQYHEADNLLLSTLALDDFTPSKENTSVKTFSQITASERLDAEYYQPKYDDIERKLIDYDPNIKTLAEVALYIFTGEYSEDYCGMDENKDLRYYIRGTDINGGKVEKDISHCVNPKGFTKFVTTGDIVTGRVGTIGNFGVIDKTLDSAVYSDNILCFHLPDTYLPEAYAVYFNSPMIQQLIIRLARGSVQQRLNQETLREVLVPFIKSDTQQEIAEKVRHSFALREQSKALLKVATRAVEIAIEQDETAGMKYLQEAQQAKDEKLRHPSWGDFYASESRQEKEAILQKIFNGALTPKETELFFPKDGEDK